MTRQPISQWPDKTGRAHPTLEASIISDIEDVIGKACANIAVEHVAELAPLLNELTEARADRPVVTIRAVRAV